MDLERKMISFTVPGDPIPQPRPRVTSRGVYYAERARGSKRMSYVDYKEWVKLSLLRSRPFPNHYLMLVPDKNFSLGLKIYLGGHGLGDLNAFQATIMDALEGVVWANDRQVSKATVERFYNDPNPRVEVEIEEERIGMSKQKSRANIAQDAR